MAAVEVTKNFLHLFREWVRTALKNKKAQALLVYLVLTGKPHNREHLASLLWGDRFDEQARASLRQTLHALRKAVGDGVVEGEDSLHLAPGALNLALAEADFLTGFRTGQDGFDQWLDAERDRPDRA